ncbi:Lrp/AsnC ligand binding domain-containing protein [Martelella limonii]|uniref:Lrp/AsnC ligand binding domain-containing protein n=1 Tax=Martelella limonii TaxID=1647649 RepID=UPI00157FFB60|nr:Lrp/AsnC ligand binding domain-containing protein [Martelella limonii]
MQTIFVQFKCQPGHAYDVADLVVRTLEETSEIYSTSGHYDLLAKFYLGKDADIGHFVTSKLQTIEGVKETFTIVTFKAFS